MANNALETALLTALSRRLAGEGELTLKTHAGEDGTQFLTCQRPGGYWGIPTGSLNDLAEAMIDSLLPSQAGSIQDDYPEYDAITVSEAAALAGCTVQNIHLAIQKGQLSSVQAFQPVLLQRAEVQAWRTAPKNKGGRPKTKAQDKARST